jgi:hypothetical protein
MHRAWLPGRLYGIGRLVRRSQADICSQGARGFTPAVWASVFMHFRGLETYHCPFENLPESRRGQWSEGSTAADMHRCRRLKPRLTAVIDYLEWTGANHLRTLRWLNRAVVLPKPLLVSEPRDPQRIDRVVLSPLRLLVHKASRAQRIQYEN